MTKMTMCFPFIIAGHIRGISSVPRVIQTAVMQLPGIMSLCTFLFIQLFDTGTEEWTGVLKALRAWASVRMMTWGSGWYDFVPAGVASVLVMTACLTSLWWFLVGSAHCGL